MLAALGALLSGLGGMALQYLLALLLSLGRGFVFYARRRFDLTALSFVALALDTLLLAGVVQWATNSSSNDFLGVVFLIGLTAAGLLAGTVMFLMHMLRTRSVQADVQDKATTDIAANPPGHPSTHPSLGATLLVLVVAAMGGRQRIAVLAALAALWIVGSFYYLLSWPLATEAMVMAVAGVMLAMAAWLLLRELRELRESSEARSHRQAQADVAGSAMPAHAWKILRWGLPVTALLTILSAQVAMHDKETLIARGQAVFVQLAPRDPRSRMQGDYMALAQVVPSFDGESEWLSASRPMALARRDARGIAQILRVLPRDQRGALAADELLIELTPKDGRWVIASDAWYFKEGEAARWERARFAEYRITPEGRALLVNLRGPDLEPL